MKLAFPLYEGDGIIRVDAASSLASRDSPGELEIRLEMLRSRMDIVAAWHRVAAGFKRLGKWLDRARQRDDEAYLDRSQNHADLERRTRALENRGRLDYL